MHYFNAVNVSDGDIAMSNQKECTYKIKFGFSEYRKMKGVKRQPKQICAITLGRGGRLE